MNDTRCALIRDENGKITCIWLEDNFDLREMDPTWSVTFPTVRDAARLFSEEVSA